MTTHPTPRRAGGLASPADRLIFFPLLCLYAILVQFGSLVRFSTDESSRGVSTGIVLVVIGLGAWRCLRALLEEQIFWVLGILIVYLTLPSLLVSEPRAAFGQLFELTGYVLLAAVISRTNLRASQVGLLWGCIAVGVLLSAGLTIADFAGVVDVPYNNDLLIETKAGGQVVQQATGFFARRSGMAAVFSLGITGSLVLGLAHRSLTARGFFLVAGVAGLLCLFLTHNRSGVLGSGFVVLAYASLSPRFRGASRIGILLASTLVGLGFLAIVYRYYPEHVSIYLVKLGFRGLAETSWESDYARVDLFQTALKSLTVRPLGNGLTLIELPGGLSLNPHNLITAIIWGAGIFAFVWLPLLGVTLYVYFGRRFGSRRGAQLRANLYGDAVSCALVAWLLNGMAHNTLFTGLAWLLFGVTIANRHFSARRPQPARNPAGSGFARAERGGPQELHPPLVAPR